MATYFAVPAYYVASLPGSTVNGEVTFTPNADGVALDTTSNPASGWVWAPTAGAVVNGTLQTSINDSAPVYLLAQTSDLNITGTLQYQASFQLTVGGENIPVPGFLFNAQVPRTTSDGAITINTTTLTSATANFTSADVGAVVTVAGAIASGTAGVITTIVSVTSSTTAVLSNEATATVSGAALSICQPINLITVAPATSALAYGAISPTTFGTELLTAANSAAVIALLGLAGSQDTYLGTAASQSAMLALTAVQGNWTIRTDTTPNTVWYLTGSPSTSLGSWTELPTLPSYLTLNPTGVKTAAYTAAASDFVIINTTSNTVPITLPTAPADKTRVGGKVVLGTTTSGALVNNATFTCGGSDVINKAGGSTVYTLTELNQAVTFQYAASSGIWYVVGDDVPLGSLDQRYQTATNLTRPLNNTFVVIGDSENSGIDIYYNSSTGATYLPCLNGMFFHCLAVQSFQRMRYAGYYSTNGITLALVETTLVPTVLALNPAPGACIVMAGAGDCWLGTSFSTMVSSLKSIVASLRGAKILPILCTVPPDENTTHVTTGDVSVRQWNTWIRRYAALQGLPLIDAYTPCAQTNGTWITSLSEGDSLNMGNLGHAAVAAQALSDGLADIFTPAGTVLTSRASSDLVTMFGNGTSLNYGVFTTNTSGVGTGLTQSGTGTASIVTPTSSDQLAGNWQQFARFSGQTGLAYLYATISSSKWNVGDTLAFSARIQSSGISAGDNGMFCALQQGIPGGYASPIGTETAMEVGMYGWQSDVEDGLMYVEFQVLPGTTSLTLILGMAPEGSSSIVGNPVVRWGEVTIVDLTTQGLLV